MFAPPLPAHHPALAPHHLPLGIHPPHTPPSPHDFLHSPGPVPDEHLRSTSPGLDRPPSRAATEFADDGRTLPMNAVTKHPKLRLQLTLGADVFEAGGNVHGRMELSSLTGKGMRIGEIAVELEAAEELHSRDHSARQTFLYARTLFQGAHLPPSNAVLPQAPITTSSHTHSGTTVWWAARKGKTTFPFSFPVPTRAPSSVQFAGNASLRYVLKGTAQIWIASSTSSGASPHDHQHQQRHLITVRAEVPVVEHWPIALARSLPSHPLFHEAVEAVADTRLFLGGNGAVWLEAGLLRSIFLSGSEIHLRLSVRNNTKRHVSGVKVSLARRLVFPVSRNDERDPGGPGSLLRPPAKTYALTGSQQPMITEVVCEQSFKSAGGTSSQAGVSYEFPPNEETVCVLPVRIPYDLRTVGIGVPCGPEHGGEELAAAHGQGHVQDPRHPPGSGWSGRSLLFEVQVLLRVALPLGALAKDLTVELPIWVVHPRSVGAEGVKVLMEAHDLVLQNPQHQVPAGPDGQHHDAHRPRHRQSLDSHSQSYHNVPVQRPHSSAGHHQPPAALHQLGNMSPMLHAADAGQVSPYQLPASPAPHSLAPLQQYAIERGWSPAPVVPGAQPLQLPSIATVLPARPASAMDSYRPLPSPASPAPAAFPNIAPGMMVAIPQMPAGFPYPVTNAQSQGDGAAAGFVFDPNATQWRASQMLVSPDAMARQGSTIQRSASAAPDVGSSFGRHDGSAILTLANLGNAPTRQQQQVPPSPQPQQVSNLPARRPSLGNEESSSEVRRSVSGPLPLPGSSIEESSSRISRDGGQVPPKPCPSPGPQGRAQPEPPKHKHTPTPPASMLSGARVVTDVHHGSGSTGQTVAAPTPQRAPPTPTDIYAQLAMHTHSRMLSEVPEEGDEFAEEDEEEEVSHALHEPVAPAPAASASGSTLGRAPSRLESQSPAPSRSPTVRDIAALEDMADGPVSPRSEIPAPAASKLSKTEEERSATPKAVKEAKPKESVVMANVGPKATPAAPRPLGRSSSTFSVTSQGAGLDALEARLSRPITPLATPSRVSVTQDDTAAAVESKPASTVRDKRLSLPAPSSRTAEPKEPSRITEQGDRAPKKLSEPLKASEGSKKLPQPVEASEGSKKLPQPEPSLVRSVKQQVMVVPTPSKAPSEAEALLNKRRESLKKVETVSSPKPFIDAASASQREAEQRALNKKAVDRVAGWLTQASSPSTSSLVGVVEMANIGKGGGDKRGNDSDTKLDPKVETFVRRVSAFDMIDAVNRPKTPSASVLLSYQAEAHANKPLPIPISTSSSAFSGKEGASPSSLEAPTMAELLAASGIEPMDKDKDGDSAMGSVNTFKPKARLTGKGGAPALDFSNMNSAASASVTNPSSAPPATFAAAVAAVAPTPRAPVPVKNKTAAAVAAFEIISGGPRVSRGRSGTGDNASSAAGSEGLKFTAPKIKPLKKPTSAGVFLNSAAATKPVFAAQPSAAAPATPASKAPASMTATFTTSPSAAEVESGMSQLTGEPTSASGLKVHPYSALALRPSRRQSVDFKGRAAAFEGTSNAPGPAPAPEASIAASPSSSSALSNRHRSRASIDVVRASPAAWDPTPNPAPSSASGRAVAAQAPVPAASRRASAIASIGKDDAGAWMDRFAPRSSGPGSGSTSTSTFSIAPSATALKAAPAHAPAAPSAKEGSSSGLLVPGGGPLSKKDLTTVDGRGTTKAIGPNRLRELRSVWGS
ncbi:hypothetical protein OC834_004257 [Tilletia horrida]|nr:hypothetical protein OC834_004257 [Tilletia horrida]